MWGTNWSDKAGISVQSSRQRIFRWVEKLLQSTRLPITNEGRCGGGNITAETNNGVFFPRGFLIKVSLCLKVLFADPPFRTRDAMYESGAGLPEPFFPSYPLTTRASQSGGQGVPARGLEGISTTTSPFLALCSRLLTNQPTHMAKPQLCSQPGRPAVY